MTKKYTGYWVTDNGVCIRINISMKRKAYLEILYECIFVYIIIYQFNLYILDYLIKVANLAVVFNAI